MRKMWVETVGPLQFYFAWYLLSHADLLGDLFKRIPFQQDTGHFTKDALSLHYDFKVIF